MCESRRYDMLALLKNDNKMEEETIEERDFVDQLIQDSKLKGFDTSIRVKPKNTHICPDMLSVYEITKLIGDRAVTIEQTDVYYCDISHLSDLEKERLTAISLA